MGIDGSGATRGGGDGFHNEDVFVVEDGLGLYLVCDGASDSEVGEVAAQTAREALTSFVRRSTTDFDLRRGRVARLVLERAMTHAVRAVEEVAARESADTTITALLAHRHLGLIGHRGDSRAYLIRRERCVQLTVDHELTEAVGNGATAASPFDVFAVDLRGGDTLVLCTDGAEAVVENAEITRVAGDLSPRVLASRIVSAAHRRDPDADATAVVVRVREDREPGWLELSDRPQGTAFGHVLTTG